MPNTEERPLFMLEQKLRCRWQHLRKADSEAFEARNSLATILEKGVGKFATEDANLVVFGSLARREWIDWESDLDWTYLIDGQANSRHLKITQQIRATLEKEGREIDGRFVSRFAEPGATGTFGDLGFSHQLVHLIGGQDDTNKNMTQRMLLLLESVPIGSRPAYDRVVRAIIDRYLQEEAHVLIEGEKRFKVPRFLLNDIVRFWRTMAVDFASKQRDRGGKGWGLRNAKLRMSRKLIFASGLFACFRCSLDEKLQTKISTGDHDINLKHLANHMWECANSTPLDVLASTIMNYGTDNVVAESLFSSYDEFIGIMSDKEARAELKRMSPRDSRSNPVFARIRGASKSFESSLNELFFHNDDIKLLTEKYGVF
jgi:predicted nucleotidyltransferase